MITCPRCGFQTPDGTLYCPKCGYGKSNQQTPKQTKIPNRKKNNNLFIAIMAAIIMFLIAVSSCQEKQMQKIQSTKIAQTSIVKTSVASWTEIPTMIPTQTQTPVPTEHPAIAICEKFCDNVHIASVPINANGSLVGFEFNPENNTCFWNISNDGGFFDFSYAGEVALHLNNTDQPQSVRVVIDYVDSPERKEQAIDWPAAVLSVFDPAVGNSVEAYTNIGAHYLSGYDEYENGEVHGTITGNIETLKYVMNLFDFAVEDN